MDVVIAWWMHHPLQGVSLLGLLAALIGAGVSPGFAGVIGNHPRC
jgi:hypothetical protein